MKLTQDTIHPQMLLGEDGKCVAMCTSIAAAHAISESFNAFDDLANVADAWSKAMWLSGIASIENSNDPIEALLFKTRAALEKAGVQS